jgi:hypothetical protein
LSELKEITGQDKLPGGTGARAIKRLPAGYNVTDALRYVAPLGSNPPGPKARVTLIVAPAILAIPSTCVRISAPSILSDGAFVSTGSTGAFVSTGAWISTGGFVCVGACVCTGGFVAGAAGAGGKLWEAQPLHRSRHIVTIG